MKQPMRMSLTLALVLACGMLSGVALNWRAWAQELSPLAAYTASAVETHVNADGTERSRRVRLIARRADGSRAVHERRYYKSKDGLAREHPVNHIWNVQTRQRVSVYPLVEAKVSAQLGEEALATLASKPDLACASVGRDWVLEDDSTDQTLAGQRVIVRQRQLRTSDGLHVGPVEREWVAPELDCLVMRRITRRDDDEGKLSGETRMEITQVTLGEPDADMFAVSSDFHEMSPSQVMKAQNQLFGIECAQCALNSAENADRRYYRNRPLQN